MTNFNGLSRRALLAAGAALPAAGLLRPGEARAEAPMLGASTPLHYRFKLGGFEVTPILAGTGPRENPQTTFGLNVSPEEFAAVSAAAFIPADRSQNFFTPTLANTGAELVLFDAGLSAEGTLAALTAAGYAADQVDVVVLSHMHGDHIGGLMSEAGPTFPKARYVAGAIENNHWSAAASPAYEKSVRPLLDRFSFIDDGAEVAPGITALAAFGHTPGHLAFHLESEGKRLVLTADLANHAVWSLGRPDWEVSFDMDKPAAAQTRKRILGMLATDRIPFIAYHFAFPGAGYVEATDEGFRHVPVSYQLLLNG